MTKTAASQITITQYRPGEAVNSYCSSGNTENLILEQYKQYSHIQMMRCEMPVGLNAHYIFLIPWCFTTGLTQKVHSQGQAGRQSKDSNTSSLKRALSN